MLFFQFGKNTLCGGDIFPGILSTVTLIYDSYIVSERFIQKQLMLFECYLAIDIKGHLVFSHCVFLCHHSIRDWETTEKTVFQCPAKNDLKGESNGMTRFESHWNVKRSFFFSKRIRKKAHHHLLTDGTVCEGDVKTFHLANVWVWWTIIQNTHRKEYLLSADIQLIDKTEEDAEESKTE